jgi:hypothetical protein
MHQEGVISRKASSILNQTPVNQEEVPPSVKEEDIQRVLDCALSVGEGEEEDNTVFNAVDE